jgi:hypothetical protein
MVTSGTVGLSSQFWLWLVRVSRPPLRGREIDMPLNENNDPEMSYRRGYQDGALETLRAVDRFLDPALQYQ